mgnify:CR=1 FL=1
MIIMIICTDFPLLSRLSSVSLSNKNNTNSSSLARGPLNILGSSIVVLFLTFQQVKAMNYLGFSCSRSDFSKCLKVTEVFIPLLNYLILNFFVVYLWHHSL